MPKVFFVEINLHKKKWLINCSYNPHKNNIGSHLNVITKALDAYYGKYENVVFPGDFNAGIEETTMTLKRLHALKTPRIPVVLT